MKLVYFFYILLGLLAGCALIPKTVDMHWENTSAPTAKQVKAWKKAQKWVKVKDGWTNKGEAGKKDERPVLINGTPVDKSKYPAVIRILSDSGAGCTASLIGPQAILTAAHCAERDESVKFQTTSGASYTATCTPFEEWPSKDLDLNICKVSTIVQGITPLTVRTDKFETMGMLVDMIGYGCIQPGGGGGNDGVLRMGSGKVSGSQAFDLVLDASPSALCYGDSGGPVLFQGKQIGVNSKGNIQDKSYTTRTTLPDSKAWLESTAKSLGLLICGVNTDCGGGVIPPAPNPSPAPAPTCEGFKIETKFMTVTGVCK